MPSLSLSLPLSLYKGSRKYSDARVFAVSVQHTLTQGVGLMSMRCLLSCVLVLAVKAALRTELHQGGTVKEVTASSFKAAVLKPAHDHVSADLLARPRSSRLLL